MKASKELEAALLSIRKKHGDEAITHLTGRAVERVDVIRSGSLMLDRAMGTGGYPRGRIVEIFGPEASGKTTLTLHAIANVQSDLGVAAFIDAEHALDLTYAQNLGVNTDELLFSQPDNGEQALSVVEDLAGSGSVDLIVVDSVAALTPKAEIEGEMGDIHMGLHARLMSQALRKLVGVCSKTQTTVIFINQLRLKIGVVFGNPEVTTGGNALKFYASMRIDVRRRAMLKDAQGEGEGNKTDVKIVKNKHAPPFKEVELDILWGKGIDRVGDLINAALTEGVIEKAGAWINYNGAHLGQGFNNAIKALNGDESLQAEIADKVRGKLVTV